MFHSVVLQISVNLLSHLLGAKTKDNAKGAEVSKLTKGEILQLNILSMVVGAKVISVKARHAILQLRKPVCASVGDKVALSQRIESHWRLIRCGQIQGGTTQDVSASPLDLI